MAMTHPNDNNYEDDPIYQLNEQRSMCRHTIKSKEEIMTEEKDRVKAFMANDLNTRSITASDFHNGVFPKNFKFICLVGVKVGKTWYDLHWRIGVATHVAAKYTPYATNGVNEHGVAYDVKGWLRIQEDAL